MLEPYIPDPYRDPYEFDIPYGDESSDDDMPVLFVSEVGRSGIVGLVIVSVLFIVVELDADIGSAEVVAAATEVPDDTSQGFVLGADVDDDM